MLVALGFLLASLLGLLVASAFWTRAVRLTTSRIKQSMPVSEPEIKADRDRLKAEYAIKVHKLETGLEQAKLERARQFIEINRRDASISTLETEFVQIKADLEENQNARRVLEQTVADRLPRVEARLAEAKRLLFNRDREIAELTTGARRHKVALEQASSITAQQNAQIERLNTALTTRGGRGRGGPGDPRFEGELALRTEIETLRAKTREQATLIDRLQRRLGHGYVLQAPVRPAEAGQADGEIQRLRQNLSEAEGALASVRSATSESDAARIAFEGEIRALKAHSDDQSGEIARLKAALAAFEQYDEKAGGLRDSKVALKARLGSAQAHSDQQAATIGRLRAELAATHERLARQAAHFMDEMRRIGGGAATAAGQARRLAARAANPRSSLAERVAHVRPAASAESLRTAPPTGEPRRLESTPVPTDKRESNGHDAAGKDAGPTAGNGRPAEATPADKTDEKTAKPLLAAEMPKAPEIPVQRRRPRLLDRLTGLAKSQ